MTDRYICPMRDEGERTYPEPGDCPVCGMRLVKVVEFGERPSETEDEELIAYRSMRLKLILSALCSIPVLILSMGELVPGFAESLAALLPMKTNLLIQFALSIPVVLLFGSFIFVKGYRSVADPIKETTSEAIRLLHELKVHIVMLTGDNSVTAKAVAESLGLYSFRSECMPEDKFAEVKRLQAEGAFVAMAGDGINDAPALAQADVGIAMGTGTDVAMESADITLVKGDLIGIARAKSLSVLVMRNIKQNLFFAFAYNVIGIPIAALGLLTPIFAGLAMALSSVSVLGNALRVKGAKIR